MDFTRWFIKYSWVVNLCLLAAISMISAKTANEYLANRYLTPARTAPSEALSAPAAPQAYHPDPASIAKRNLFDAVADAGEGSAPSGDALAGGTGEELRDTALDLKLLGIIYHQPASPFNLATIYKNKAQTTGVYMAGNTIEGATVDEVDLDQVILARNGERESLRIDSKKKPPKPDEIGQQAALDRATPEQRAEMLRARRARLAQTEGKSKFADKIKQVGDNQYQIEKAAIDEALGDINSIITQARAIPNLVGDGENRITDGFRIYRIQPGSIYEALGLKNGDVIKSINGEKMDTIETGLKLFQQLRNETKFHMEVERQGQVMEMGYEVQ